MLQALPDDSERLALERSLRDTGKDILSLDFDQLEAFAGNMLEVHDRDGQPLLVMSASAWAPCTRRSASMWSAIRGRWW